MATSLSFTTYIYNTVAIGIVSVLTSNFTGELTAACFLTMTFSENLVLAFKYFAVNLNIYALSISFWFQHFWS